MGSSGRGEKNRNGSVGKCITVLSLWLCDRRKDAILWKERLPGLGVVAPGRTGLKDVKNAYITVLFYSFT